MSSPAPNTLLPLPWDTALIGLPVAAIHAQHLPEAGLRTLVAAARAQGFQLVYLFVAPEQDRVSAALGPAAGPAYANILYRWCRLDGPPLVPAVSPLIRPARVPTAALEALALQGGEWSRFRRDQRLAPGVFPALYRHWLHRALSTPDTYQVLEYRRPNVPAQGLLTIINHAQYTIMDLMAVDRASRGQGIGRQFIEAARQHALTQGHGEVRLTTQLDNTVACRLYEHCGFEPGAVTRIYHLWLDQFPGAGEGVGWPP